jgi:hypothetical protein
VPCSALLLDSLGHCRCHNSLCCRLHCCCHPHCCCCRYPSYVEANGWRFPGVGEFQCYDRRALASLAAAAAAAGRPEWGYAGPHDSGGYNSSPGDTGFFAPGGSWDTGETSGCVQRVVACVCLCNVWQLPPCALCHGLHVAWRMRDKSCSLAMHTCTAVSRSWRAQFMQLL